GRRAPPAPRASRPAPPGSARPPAAPPPSRSAPPSRSTAAPSRSTPASRSSARHPLRGTPIRVVLVALSHARHQHAVRELPAHLDGRADGQIVRPAPGLDPGDGAASLREIHDVLADRPQVDGLPNLSGHGHRPRLVHLRPRTAHAMTLWPHHAG